MPEARPLRVVLCGISGRMGRALATRIAQLHDLRVVGGIDRQDTDTRDAGTPVETPESAGPLIAGCDVVIDFSAPPFLHDLIRLRAAEFAGRALVSGTTGVDAETEAALVDLSRHAALVRAANFGLGVNLLLALVERAARALPMHSWDTEIVEAHHRDKADAPSGTALALGEAVARGRGQALDEVRRDGRSGRPGARPAGEIGFHSLRGGAVTGEHRVLFLGTSERIELSHLAESRALFADGALAAARWVAGRAPGRYTMADVLGLGSP
jgi:4-hydroxy-tetrahydrodipicolinate reductase